MNDDIDDIIEEWEQSTTNIPLSEFMGLTKEEYATWVEHPDSPIADKIRKIREGRANLL
jgi:hypothetical protein